ncbi:Ctf8-domain-containing protein [Polychytrium aggregatum]|uniref:Ctf8-domain-containing protein n=1 Tax=Polychytrium aggregatum TaxID=110093 RepID=UPI0022FF094C|nr:Ctf8-domain-containing protein [Polychytrium aggregatum]KAI9208789.1 Ctf8-domain-containing protein [Polychytrium aggregatum]
MVTIALPTRPAFPSVPKGTYKFHIPAGSLSGSDPLARSDTQVASLPVSGTADSPLPWVLLELQGTLEIDRSAAGAAEQPLHVGELHFNEKGRPYLTIGHHRLEGTKVDLGKPLAMVCPHIEQAPPSDGALDDQRSRTTDSCYDVLTIFRSKYVFNLRPEPIIADRHQGLVQLKK